MNDHELDQLLRQAQPASAVRVPVVAPLLREAGQELLEAIVAIDPQSDRSESGPAETTLLLPRPGRGEASRSWSRGRRRLVGVAVAATVVAAIAVPTAVFQGAGPGNQAVSPSPASSASSSPQPRPPAVTGNPYLLLDGPLWEIENVSQTASLSGEITFRRKSTDISLQIGWNPISGYQYLLDDRRSAHKGKQFTFLGRKALLFPAGQGEFEVLAKRGNAFLGVRSTGTATRKDLDELLGQLRPVTAEEWLAAMPKSVVTPSETTTVAAQMLRDVPLPDGFDASIFTTAFTNEYDQFGFRVVAKVTCAWLADYAQARTAHDEAGMAAADAALSSSKNWPVVKRLGAPDPIGAELFIKAVSHRQIVADYESNLGCDY
jgi:hypothetical protein